MLAEPGCTDGVDTIRGGQAAERKADGSQCGRRVVELASHRDHSRHEVDRRHEIGDGGGKGQAPRRREIRISAEAPRQARVAWKPRQEGREALRREWVVRD